MRRKPSILAILFLGALVGCTSILGDFEVGAGGSSGNGEGGPCTQCGDKCVDLATDNANCGACGTACSSGKLCQASKCACAPDKAFCNNECVMASRQACGETCTPCQQDEICNAGCVPAPLATIKTPPPSPVGWIGPDSKELTIELTPVTAPGTIYECRTGPDATFTPTEPAWGPCDGDKGTGTTHKPKPNATTPEGTYRTEFRYRSDTFRSTTATARYYVHHALDKVATCPRPGIKEDGPHFKDEQYFDAALQFGLQNQQIYPTGATFPQPKNPSSRTDDIIIDNPFIKIPFKQIFVPPNLQGGNGWPATNSDIVLNDRSLRHKFVLNPQRNLLLVKRAYVHPKKNNCVTTYKVGNSVSGNPNGYGPLDANRGERKLACEAFVLNSRGAALCLQPNKEGTAPTAVPIDQHPFYPGNTGPGSATGVARDTSVTLAPVPTGFPVVGYYLFLGNRWYRVTTVAPVGNGAKVGLAEPLAGPLTNSPYRYSGQGLASTIVAPTGYAKLLEDGIFAASGVKPGASPEFRTKCEKPGCGNTFLTYLPP